SPECFVLALVYIDRLIQRNSLLLNSLNVHRIIITAVMLAAKFFDDQYYNNAYYAKVGGVPTSEVNSLELEFLFCINFTLHVPTDVYEKYYSELANHMGVGVPPELMVGNTCDCVRHATAISYADDELRNTGMLLSPLAVRAQWLALAAHAFLRPSPPGAHARTSAQPQAPAPQPHPLSRAALAGMRPLADMAKESLAAFAAQAAAASAQAAGVGNLVDGMSTMAVDDPIMSDASVGGRMEEDTKMSSTSPV
ncbi:hypothetical protein EON66_08370, partial [archaeon]